MRFSRKTLSASSLSDNAFAAFAATRALCRSCSLIASKTVAAEAIRRGAVPLAKPSARPRTIGPERSAEANRSRAISTSDFCTSTAPDAPKRASSSSTRLNKSSRTLSARCSVMCKTCIDAASPSAFFPDRAPGTIPKPSTPYVTLSESPSFALEWSSSSVSIFTRTFRTSIAPDGRVGGLGGRRRRAGGILSNEARARRRRVGYFVQLYISWSAHAARQSRLFSPRGALPNGLNPRSGPVATMVLICLSWRFARPLGRTEPRPVTIQKMERRAYARVQNVILKGVDATYITAFSAPSRTTTFSFVRVSPHSRRSTSIVTLSVSSTVTVSATGETLNLNKTLPSRKSTRSHSNAFFACALRTLVSHRSRVASRIARVAKC
ncbi:hypothetical protein BE221DRAFT_74093 [Ostreococcus tauri]|uniref:Uncharacterized protein n=1 Tax=Ostreococcus tauri TaxID=70448 RepID=A0A1Y5IAE0_OSTTA|nr:hypothetical protein BE221DRAFT_74093 [Ostreococcus tauri]